MKRFFSLSLVLHQHWKSIASPYRQNVTTRIKHDIEVKSWSPIIIINISWSLGSIPQKTSNSGKLNENEDNKSKCVCVCVFSVVEVQNIWKICNYDDNERRSTRLQCIEASSLVLPYLSLTRLDSTFINRRQSSPISIFMSLLTRFNRSTRTSPPSLRFLMMMMPLFIKLTRPTRVLRCLQIRNDHHHNKINLNLNLSIDNRRGTQSSLIFSNSTTKKKKHTRGKISIRE